MRVLIVGGSGFIGSHLTDLLIAKGQTVRVYNRSHNPYQKQHREVEYIYGNLADDALLETALKDIDVVYQLVSSTVPSTSNNDPIGDVSSNVIDMLKFIQYCVTASVRKIIFPSSGGTVYGLPQKIPIDEAQPSNPICSYGITKLTVEKYLSLYHYLYGLDYTVLRISNPYGPRQNPTGKVGAITIFLDRIIKNIPIHIWGNGEIVRDYVYIYDVAQALYSAQEFDLSEKVFNIGMGKGTTLNELLNKIRQVINYDFQVEYIEGRQVDVTTNILDISRANTILKWQPTVQLEVGIEKTWQWLKTLDSQF